MIQQRIQIVAVAERKQNKGMRLIGLILLSSGAWWACSGMQEIEAGSSFCLTQTFFFILATRVPVLQVQGLLPNILGEQSSLRMFSIMHIWWAGPVVRFQGDHGGHCALRNWPTSGCCSRWARDYCCHMQAGQKGSFRIGPYASSR